MCRDRDQQSVRHGDDVFLGYDIAHNKTYSDGVLSEIDREVKSLVDGCYEEARSIIMKNRDILEKSCALLMEKEKISGEQFDALFQDRKEAAETEA